MFTYSKLIVDIMINGSYPIPTGMIQLNGSGDYVDVRTQSDEALVAHDHASVISEFWGYVGSSYLIG